MSLAPHYWEMKEKEVRAGCPHGPYLCQPAPHS